MHNTLCVRAKNWLFWHIPLAGKKVISHCSNASEHISSVSRCNLVYCATRVHVLPFLWAADQKLSLRNFTGSWHFVTNSYLEWIVPKITIFAPKLWWVPSHHVTCMWIPSPIRPTQDTPVITAIHPLRQYSSLAFFQPYSPHVSNHGSPIPFVATSLKNIIVSTIHLPHPLPSCSDINRFCARFIHNALSSSQQPLAWPRLCQPSKYWRILIILCFLRSFTVNHHATIHPCIWRNSTKSNTLSKSCRGNHQFITWCCFSTLWQCSSSWTELWELVRFYSWWKWWLWEHFFTSSLPWRVSRISWGR